MGILNKIKFKGEKMSKDEFLEAFADILQTDEALSFEMNLATLDGWDSLSKITTLAFMDREFGVTMLVNQLDNLKTIGDIAAKCGIE